MRSRWTSVTSSPLNSRSRTIGSFRHPATSCVPSWRITRSARSERVVIRGQRFREYRVARIAHRALSTSCIPPRKTSLSPPRGRLCKRPGSRSPLWPKSSTLASWRNSCFLRRVSRTPCARASHWRSPSRRRIATRFEPRLQSQMQGLELLVPLIEGIDEGEQERAVPLIRSVISLALGVSFLSTVTKATDHIDFNGFAEPIRRSLMQRERLSWSDVRRAVVADWRTPHGDPFHDRRPDPSSK